MLNSLLTIRLIRYFTNYIPVFMQFPVRLRNNNNLRDMSRVITLLDVAVKALPLSLPYTSPLSTSILDLLPILFILPPHPVLP